MPNFLSLRPYKNVEVNLDTASHRAPWPKALPIGRSAHPGNRMLLRWLVLVESKGTQILDLLHLIFVPNKTALKIR